MRPTSYPAFTSFSEAESTYLIIYLMLKSADQGHVEQKEGLSQTCVPASVQVREVKLEPPPPPACSRDNSARHESRWAWQVATWRSKHRRQQRLQVGKRRRSGNQCSL
ncbi:UNVERIFIED_CONTAM: hypothetical protein K2H54_075143 [Gekko kuhli]